MLQKECRMTNCDSMKIWQKKKKLKNKEDPRSWKYSTGTPCTNNILTDIDYMAAKELKKINAEFIQSLRNISLKYQAFVEWRCFVQGFHCSIHSNPMKTKQMWLYWEKFLPLRSGSLLWGKTWLELTTSYKYCPLWVYVEVV